MPNRPMFAAMALLAVTTFVTPVLAQDGSNGNGSGKPFQLGVEQNIQGQAPSYPAYPAPAMIPQQPKPAAIPKPPKQKPIKLKAEQDAPRQPPMMRTGATQEQQPPPMQATVTQAAPPPGVLPQQFMGNWLVLGNRSKITARPEYQNGIEGIFTSSNSQTWNIVGGPGGYSMSSSSGVQSVQVGNCTSTTAFVRYAHPIGKTVAQEAIVMQLSPDGQSFQGMQRITIMKQGEGGPRAQVTYQLMGRRQ